MRDNTPSQRTSPLSDRAVTVSRGWDSKPVVRRYDPSEPGPRVVKIEPDASGGFRGRTVSGSNARDNHFRNSDVISGRDVSWSNHNRGRFFEPVDRIARPDRPHSRNAENWSRHSDSRTIRSSGRNHRDWWDDSKHSRSGRHEDWNGRHDGDWRHGKHHDDWHGKHHDDWWDCDDDDFFFGLSIGFGSGFFFGYSDWGCWDNWYWTDWCGDRWPYWRSCYYGPSVVFADCYGRSCFSFSGCSCWGHYGVGGGWWWDDDCYRPCVGSYYGSCYSSYASYPVYVPAVDYVPYEVATPVLTIGEAWDLLAAGRFDAAREAFSQLLTAGVEVAEARIGYALSLAFLGRHDAAVRSMRQAAVDESHAFTRVVVDGRLDSYLRVILSEYVDQVRKSPRDTDALFMIAAVRFLLHEDADAYFAIDSALRAGDTDQSTHLLRNVIDDAMRGMLFKP